MDGFCVLFFLFLLISMATTEFIDLTQLLDSETVFWPGSDSYNYTNGFHGVAENGYWYETNSFAMSEHTGTHMDAPRHFAKGRWGVDEIPPSHLVVPAIVIDISSKAWSNRSAVLSTADIRQWTSIHGKIPAGSLVLVRTDWSDHYRNKTAYLGTAGRDPSKLDFPGIGIDAARTLSELDICGVGIDTASIDPGSSVNFKAHQILGAKNLYNLENLTNLRLLPPNGARVYANCLYIYSGSGAPCRILAEVSAKPYLSYASLSSPLLPVIVLLMIANVYL